MTGARREAIPSLHQSNLNPTRYGRLPIVLPPSFEQDAIVAWLDEETAAVSAAVARADHEIVLLHEYRTRLIADVVTGKLDVRDAATRLPDEVEEPEGTAEPDASVEINAESAEDLDSVA